MVKAVLFDFANTLFDYETFMERSWSLEIEVIRIYGYNTSKKTFLNARKRALSTPGICWKTPEYWSTLLRSLEVKSDPILSKTMLDKFNRLSKPLILRTAKPYSESYNVLRGLRKLGFKIGVVSNLTKWEAKFLNRYNLRRYLDSVVISEIAGVQKPSPKAFLLILKKLKCKPEEAIMIGDRYDIDIAPAKTLAMKTIRVRRGWFANQLIQTNQMKPDYEVQNLQAALRVIKRIVAQSKRLR